MHARTQPRTPTITIKQAAGMAAAATRRHASHGGRERGGHGGRPQDGPPQEPLRRVGAGSLGPLGAGMTCMCFVRSPSVLAWRFFLAFRSHPCVFSPSSFFLNALRRLVSLLGTHTWSAIISYDRIRDDDADKVRFLSIIHIILGAKNSSKVIGW